MLDKIRLLIEVYKNNTETKTSFDHKFNEYYFKNINSLKICEKLLTLKEEDIKNYLLKNILIDTSFNCTDLMTNYERLIINNLYKEIYKELF